MIMLIGALLAVYHPVRADDVPYTTPVSRLPGLQEPLDPILKEIFDDTRARGGQIINQQLTYGHAPKINRANRALAYALRFEAETPRLLREIAIIRTAQLLDGQYELNQHYPLALGCGITRAQLDAMPNWKASDLFDERQRAVLGYTEAVVKNRGDVDDATFSQLAKLFSPKQIVELTITIGNYTSTALFTKALKVEVETDGRGVVPGKC
jgi:alkylhydroperoxidase family enzyme